jgi:hypothetical protein
MLSKTGDKEDYLQQVMLTNKAAFQRMVPSFNTSIEFGDCSNQIHETRNVEVWFGKENEHVAGPLLFLLSSVERTVTGGIYIDLWELFVFPKLKLKKKLQLVLISSKTAPNLISVYRLVLLWMLEFAEQWVETDQLPNLKEVPI